ncbi:outer membrane protein [Legionella sainthelensi]|uniref:outer membrane protein n=1 Tax=Legionella sainthelensi TaxID=28087 RepID=UPI000E20C6D9|nr:outer membrane beta-barrel protein [Legionella sainthelensi]
MASFNLSWLLNGISVLLFASSSYSSVGIPVANDTSPTPTGSPWKLEFGTRYWLSSGKYTEMLYDLSNNMISRLTYFGLSGNAAEGFWQLKHKNGFFLKGYFGGGSIDNGQLKDEDFPPALTPYSSTLSNQKNGVLNYLTVDLGYDLFKYKNWALSSFLGYFYWMEQYNTFSCRQVGGNPDICVTDRVPLTVNGLKNNFELNSLRIGVNSSFALSETLHLLTDVAYIHSNLSNFDFHNTRPDIRGFPSTASGYGVQLDTLLNWMLNPDFTMGIGGRWWYLASKGFSHFEEVFVSGKAQPDKIAQNRYGLMLQAKYTFDQHSGIANGKEVFSWSGFYLGPNLGYGTNYHSINITPTTFATLQTQFLPNNLRAENSGFLGGGQIGYNWRKAKIIVGLEADLDYSDLSDTNGVTSDISNITTSVSTNINWLGTVRGRLGKLASDSMLIYFTTGVAFAEAKLSFDQLFIGSGCQLNLCSKGYYTQTKTGWTAGTGLEYTVSQSTTFKAEYLFVGLGNIYTNTTGDSYLGMANYYVSSHVNSNIVRFGLNYKVS